MIWYTILLYAGFSYITSGFSAFLALYHGVPLNAVRSLILTVPPLLVLLINPEISVTLSEIFISVSELQFSNAPTPIDSTPSGIVTDVSELHLLKAPLPILFTLLGIAASFRLYGNTPNRDLQAMCLL